MFKKIPENLIEHNIFKPTFREEKSVSILIKLKENIQAKNEEIQQLHFYLYFLIALILMLFFILVGFYLMYFLNRKKVKKNKDFFEMTDLNENWHERDITT
jgi:uncharacterized membrane protein